MVSLKMEHLRWGWKNKKRADLLRSRRRDSGQREQLRVQRSWGGSTGGYLGNTHLRMSRDEHLRCDRRWCWGGNDGPDLRWQGEESGLTLGWGEAVWGHNTGEVESDGPSEIILVALWKGSTGAGAPVRTSWAMQVRSLYQRTNRMDSVLFEALHSEVSKIITNSPKSAHPSNERKKVAQLCPTLCDPMDCSLPGSSIHGIFQTRILEWVAISFSRGSPRPRDWTRVSRIVGRRFAIWATREVPPMIFLLN